MKKKIIIALLISTLLAAIGASYLLVLNEKRSNDFNSLITLYRAEIMREQLLLNIRTVEADLQSRELRNSESREGILGHISDMQAQSEACFSCHHTDVDTERIRDLKQQVEHYAASAVRMVNSKPGTEQYRTDEEMVDILSDSLVSKLNTMIVLTNKKLSKETDHSFHVMSQTRIMVIMLVVAGPLMIALLGATAMRSFTTPIRILLKAARRFKTGNLEHRVEGLTDEYAELALAFDDMAQSLREHLNTIEESQQRYRILFESAADAIFILSTEPGEEGRILNANQAAAKMHGYSVEELLAMNIGELDSPETASLIPERMKQLLDGRLLHVEAMHRRKNDGLFPVDIHAVAFDVAARKYILAIDRDISEKKTAVEALQREKQSKIVAEMATGLAHEIKNPLAGIKVTIDILSEESNLSAEDRAALKRVIVEIQRIEMLMKGLLSFARPPKPQLSKTKVHDVLNTAVDLTLKERSMLRNADNAIYIVRDFDDTLPEIQADPMQLQQVFMNLLLNAAEAMPKGGTVFLKICPDLDTHMAKIEIADTGPGIDEKALKSIFQPFYSKKSAGTGLGLAITLRLIEEHGGNISVENIERGGAMFTVRLPMNGNGARRRRE